MNVIENSPDRLVISSRSYGASIALFCLGAVIFFSSFMASTAIDTTTIALMRWCGLLLYVLALFTGCRLKVIFDKANGKVTRKRRALVPFIPLLNSTMKFHLSSNLKIETKYLQSTDTHRYYVRIGKPDGEYMWSIHLASYGPSEARDLERTIREWLFFALREEEGADPYY